MITQLQCTHCHMFSNPSIIYATSLQRLFGSNTNNHRIICSRGYSNVQLGTKCVVENPIVQWKLKFCAVTFKEICEVIFKMLHWAVLS